MSKYCPAEREYPFSFISSYVTAKKIGINLQDVLDKKITLTTEQAAYFAKEQLPTAYKTFAGFEIHNLFEFFMVFVVLCGIAAVILASITPILKKMMHGVK